MNINNIQLGVDNSDKIKKLKDVLNREGFLHFKDIIPKEMIEDVRKCFDDKNQTLNYNCLKSFIDNVMFGFINNELEWEAQYIKFRISDNNNSVDASAFHRDINCQDRKKELIPSFTCLAYLDKTSMELIPGSHLKLVQDYITSIKGFSDRQRVIIEPGDILIFYSTLLHRGIFTERLKHRRLIQVFDVFPTVKEYNTHSPKVIHAPGNDKYSSLFFTLSKIPIAVNIINIFGYLNTSTGYGWDSDIFKQCDIPSQFKYVSSEGLCKRIVIDPNNPWQPINKYILNKPVVNYPQEKHEYYHYVCYERQLYWYMILFIFMVFLLGFIIYKYFVKSKQTKIKIPKKYNTTISNTFFKKIT
jgi:hypothetical protein